jgi:acyl dehydratase
MFGSRTGDKRNLAETQQYYWEDFKPGESFPMGERTLDRDEIMAFARQFDPQPFHIDEEAAKRSMYGGLIASGWHTVAMVMRMMCDSYLNQSASLGSPGVDNVRWLKPVRPGDTIRAQRTVLESRVSQSRPEMGLVKTRWEVFNQDGEAVMTMEGYGMFRRRSPGAP